MKWTFCIYYTKMKFLKSTQNIYNLKSSIDEYVFPQTPFMFIGNRDPMTSIVVLYLLCLIRCDGISKN